MASQTDPATKARILCVTTYELSEHSASTRALNVACALRDQGYDVSIHQHVNRCSNPHQGNIEERAHGIDRRVIVSPRAGSFFHHYAAVAREKFDVVIGNNMNGTLYAALGRLKAPLILDLHGDMVAEFDMFHSSPSARRSISFRVRKMAYELTESVTRKLSNRISCVSHTMIKVLEKRGVPRERAVYVPNCVDLDYFKPKGGSEVSEFRNRLGITPGKLLFGYLGRMDPWQGVEQFIAAAREDNDPTTAFLVVGCKEAKIEGNLFFAGEVPLSKMCEYYSVCDAFVLPRPSHLATEVAAPTKFAEYAAMGRPIIATDVGDASDFIREYDSGVVVGNNSTGELIRGFRQMRSLSAERRMAMGREARRLAETEFTLEIARNNLSVCIDELTAGAP